ncbi:HAD-IIIC family phosphatase [Streptomyces albidus (ex Kaewkla and Franco 2022)]|uniref:HAD-IIIC family phosphatase n=1 Tax=Streptomyces albidus (ex Kaewkla and Franco 2022) TaxID=722709 RepID=UPI0015EEE581|nr:HAD-IIIC family phosphatase [Streptomyces albidus (ex Kaewkla and Franco 2022)]
MTAPASASVEPVAAGRTGPLERLRELREEGRLASDYPSVPGLLAELAQSDGAFNDLSRAGRLLARVRVEDIQEHHPEVRAVTAAVTGHGTVDALTPALTAQLARHGIPLRVVTGDFDSWLRDLRDTGSALYAPETELALCLLDPHIVFGELPAPWGVEDVAEATASKLELLDRLAGRYAEEATGTLVLNTLPMLRRHTHQLVDHRSRTELAALWREFNAGLLRLALKHPRLHVIDLEPLVAEGGPVRDTRLATYAKVHLGEELLGRYAREVGHLTRTLLGRTKKVLAVDLDNTLWDGVLGDDGPEGIAAATTYRGEAFGAFQHTVRQIGAQGVLLAACSKNDAEPVLGVLRDHPDMVLREADFVRVTANWEPKDGNLRDIAARLNLGVDSFVFADDSSFECGLVSATLPEVAVVRLSEEPALHIDALLADGWFDVRELTAEDRQRAGQYRSDAERRDLLDSAGSLEEYLADLQVRVALSPPEEHELARVSQITLRTNQFNMTTERLQQTEVRERVDSPSRLVLAVRSQDRFGDNGNVGALLATWTGDALHIDNMLLSCRVFARGIEQAAVSAVLEHARRSGARHVYARYRPTAKNHRVRGFYPSLGFETVEESPEGELVFRHDLSELPAIPEYVTLTASIPAGEPAP